MSALAGWNTDIKSAPHGRYVVKQRKEGVDTRVFVPERVILSTKCGKAVMSHYLPDKKRWMMLGDGEQPLAWQAWPEPYPHLPSGAAARAADNPAVTSAAPSGINSHAEPLAEQDSTVGPAPSEQAGAFDIEAEAEIARLEGVIEKSGGIGNALSAMLGVDVEIVRADGGADITMTHTNIAGHEHV